MEDDLAATRTQLNSQEERISAFRQLLVNRQCALTTAQKEDAQAIMAQKREFECYAAKDNKIGAKRAASCPESPGDGAPTDKKVKREREDEHNDISSSATCAMTTQIDDVVRTRTGGTPVGGKVKVKGEAGGATDNSKNIIEQEKDYAEVMHKTRRMGGERLCMIE